MSQRNQIIIASLLVIFLSIITITISNRFKLEEKVGLYLLFKLRGQIEPPSNVVVVAIDKKSADEFGLDCDSDKWPRPYHTRLIENLAKQGASAIVFDVTFNEPGNPEDDDSFARAIRNAGNVILCQYLLKEKSEDGRISHETKPLVPSFEESALAFAPSPLPDSKGTLKKTWIFKKASENIQSRKIVTKYIPTLPVVVLQIYGFQVYDEFNKLLKEFSPTLENKNFPYKDKIIEKDKSAEGYMSVEEYILFIRDNFNKNTSLGKKMLEEIDNSNYLTSDLEKKQLLKAIIKVYQGPEDHYINHYGPSGTIETIPYHKILSSGENSAKDEKLDLNGKVVFVGASSDLQPEKLTDSFHTVYTDKGLKTSGVEIAATVLANLLESKPVIRIARPWYFAIIFTWGILIVLLIRHLLSLAWSAIALIISITFYTLIAYDQFNNSGIWYPLTIPIFFLSPAAYFGVFLWKFCNLNKERHNIRNAFKYFIPEQVVEKLAKDLGSIETHTELVYGTCMFSDAENYTEKSEKMGPFELHNFLRSYYKTIFEPVKKYGGIVSDIIGDSTLSIWATSQPDASFRKNACKAALAISSAVENPKDNDQNASLPTRIGLHSGSFLIGIGGAKGHYEYRPVGDIVNTASRIESLNKFLKTRILVSQEVLDQIDGFLTRKIGEFIPKGKSESVVIYELISHEEDSNEKQKELCVIFAEGLEAFCKRSWEEATKIFEEAIQTYEDGASSYYKEIIKNYQDNPPDDDWNGIIKLDSK